MLQRIDKDEKIIITTDGTTTTARRYKGKELLGSAEAKCSPADTFDFECGARLAFGRLVGGCVVKLDVEGLAKTLKGAPKISTDLHKALERFRDNLKKAIALKPEPKPEPKFKVGDVVKVTGKKEIGHALIIGSLASVETVSTQGSGVRYTCKGVSHFGLTTQIVNESDLEKYEKGE